jgi:hypothetical protein
MDIIYGAYVLLWDLVMAKIKEKKLANFFLGFDMT